MKTFVFALLFTFTCIVSAHPHHSKIRHVAKYSSPIAFSSKSFLIADIGGQVIKGQAVDTVRPIASITKLMVGLLASEQDLNQSLTIPTKRFVQSSIPRNVKTLKRKELLTLALIKSDNFAAQILCENIKNCIEKMNNTALEIGMTHTHFDEPTGLSINNVSTASDLLKLLIVSYNVDILTDISSRATAEIPINDKFMRIRNTNPLTSKLNILLSKTGFTLPAGGCLVMIVGAPSNTRVFILLGSKNTRTRIPDMEQLVRMS